MDVVTVTPDGKMYPKADLDVVVYEFRWNSVYEQAEDGNYYWKSTADRTPVYTTTVSTDGEGVGSFVFTPAKGGQYQVTAAGTDTEGNEIRSAVFVWVADPQATWPGRAEQRPHRTGGGQEAVCPRRHGQDPGARTPSPARSRRWSPWSAAASWTAASWS